MSRLHVYIIECLGKVNTEKLHARLLHASHKVNIEKLHARSLHASRIGGACSFDSGRLFHLAGVAENRKYG